MVITPNQFELTLDGRLLVMSTGHTGFAPNVAIYQTQDWQLLHTTDFPGVIWAVSVCADGQSAALGATDGRTALLDLGTGEISKVLRPFHGSRIDGASAYAVACSPNGDFIFAGTDNNRELVVSPTLEIGNKSAGPTTIVRVSDGTTVASIYDFEGRIQQAVWDPKGRYVAFIDRRTLFVWQPLSVGTGYERIDLGGPTFSLAVAPDGGRIAVTTPYGIKIFSVE